MRWLALTACLWAMPAPAGPLAHPFEIADQVGQVYAEEGEEGVFRFLQSTLRRARAEGALTPEWSLLFMMLADAARNTRENAPYALRIADEGLELARSGSAEDREMAVLLEVSRAYILADLGRFEDAALSAVMALPAYRSQFGEAAANDLAGYAQSWSKGQLTDFNTSALAVATRVLAEADAALDRGEYGTALTLAARAYLPEGVGIDAPDLARSNSQAAFLTGQALYLLNRLPAAFVALQDAANLAVPNWATGKPDWAELPEPEAQRLADLFFWMGRTAAAIGETTSANMALDVADRLTRDPRARNTLLFARAVMQEAMGQADTAIAALQRASQTTDPALADHAALAGFYADLLTARNATSIEAMRVEALFTSAEGAIAQARPGNAISPDYIRSQTAPFLLSAGQTERALDYARRAFADRVQRISTSQDTEAGTNAAQKATRDVIDVYLASAHAMDSQNPNASCSTLEGAGCVIIRGE